MNMNLMEIFLHPYKPIQEIPDIDVGIPSNALLTMDNAMSSDFEPEILDISNYNYLGIQNNPEVYHQLNDPTNITEIGENVKTEIPSPVTVDSNEYPSTPSLTNLGPVRYSSASTFTKPRELDPFSYSYNTNFSYLTSENDQKNFYDKSLHVPHSATATPNNYESQNQSNNEMTSYSLYFSYITTDFSNSLDILQNKPFNLPPNGAYQNSYIMPYNQPAFVTYAPISSSIQHQFPQGVFNQQESLQSLENNANLTQIKTENGGAMKKTIKEPAKKGSNKFNLKEPVLITSKQAFEPSVELISCKKCDKKFAKICHFTQHINTTHTDRKFKCEKCGKKFSKENLLNTHLAKHDAEKPFKCSYENCNKEFMYKTDLKRHTYKHTGGKPYVCVICKKGFIRKDHCASHVKTHTKKPRTLLRKTKKARLLAECSEYLKIVRFDTSIHAGSAVLHGVKLSPECCKSENGNDGRGG